VAELSPEVFSCRAGLQLLISQYVRHGRTLHSPHAHSQAALTAALERLTAAETRCRAAWAILERLEGFHGVPAWLWGAVDGVLTYLHAATVCRTTESGRRRGNAQRLKRRRCESW